MGKRSDFERREADFYPTPDKAVAPLIVAADRAGHLWGPSVGCEAGRARGNKTKALCGAALLDRIEGNGVRTVIVEDASTAFSDKISRQ